MMNGPQFVAYAGVRNTQAAAAGQATPVADNKIFFRHGIDKILQLTLYRLGIG